MLKSETKNTIRRKIDDIITASDKYHFIHVTYACQLMIKNMVSSYYREECIKLSNEIRERTKGGNEIPDELVEEFEHLCIMTKEGRAHIDVDYIDTPTEDEARVVKTSNAFVINLPKSLAERAVYDDGSFNREAVSKIRKLMAHELGHLVLHTDELLKIESTQGSKNITEDEKEEEAVFFAEEILKKRDQRNEALHDGVR